MLLGLSLVIAVLFPAQVFALKLTANPTTSTLTESGSAQAVSFQLDEPIIAPDLGSGYVTLTLTNNNPSRLSLSATTVTWAWNEWSTVKTLSISAVDDALDNGDVSVNVSYLISSNSEYYNGFSGSFTTSIVDNDDPAVVASNATAASQSGLTLAATGTKNASVQQYAVLSLISSGIALLVLRIKLMSQ